ncbi:MAG: ABC transporter permease [Paracoccus sp. (in: a-proteobacteria)]|jgi:peptide/nickel transport system permease protein|uniref:ABC transporter permease n=3 Tax=Paracoccus TaxID=265 RepID=UPI000C3E2C01|nr:MULTISPECIES: ABC transporter permease [unclassified Paracoccus (in: a-proteobacteria)]MAN57992.1 ABC transporter permease [Paracoccus sp. (in: a-proteobacteria)]MBA47521.1 ABC transporter permease [Paracoccus sp. (in: a-proteobacteria)]MDB2551346.1 ABC transporter permease [Paracoccus sp. (in: a-proteobacteria)]HIC66360.1 ABC transporter permease [Paracoccus sp. (in: a-proteobacteria)]|tara:strand:- start:1047 stop:1967 length:921 start_codon:yes stop_codon:yes gene_type:complete
MLRYIVNRLLQAVIAIFGVLTIVFVVMHLSGDPTLLLVPQDASAEVIANLRRQLGFDRPIGVQYLDYLGDLLRLDFGTSVVQRVPVSQIVAARVPYTIELAAGALAVALGLGIPIGVVMATRRGGWIERGLTAVVVTGQSVPTFLSGILLIAIFGVLLRWLPTSGTGSISALVMPSIALGSVSMATFARMTRIAILDELGKDYVRAATARGMRMDQTILRHVLRNASIPLITITALEIGNLLAGAVIIETVFAWPGIGLLAIQSIQARDFLVVQMIVLLISVVYVLTSVLADLIYGFVDPRIRLMR